MKNVFRIITDKIKMIIFSIVDTVKEKIWARIKIEILYLFAKAGIVSVSMERFLNKHYWDRKSPNNLEKWIESEVRKGKPYAFLLKGHLCDYKVSFIAGKKDLSIQEIFKIGKEIKISLRDSDYEPDLAYEMESRKTMEEYKKHIILLILEAMSWYKKAAEMNYAPGQFYLFHTYSIFDSNLTLNSKSFKYLKQAAENGIPNAQYIIAQNYLANDDLINGVFLMKKAAHSKKWNWINMECYSEDRKDVKNWCKENGNILKIKEAAIRENPKALYEYSEFFSKEFLSEYFFSRNYLLHDINKENFLHLSQKYHKKAADAGYPAAMFEEGFIILREWGQGTFEEAFDYLTKAYEKGHKTASRFLADCYYYGWGTERSLEKARYYLKIAKHSDCSVNMSPFLKMMEEQFLKENFEQDCNTEWGG